ncbi:MAG: hypothetical protein F6J87_10235 [Spirulina sp. SIO3F2]|nr:hypothetical protein [Spirulina sp. SIO3F2]
MADKLWKGKRQTKPEEMVIRQIAQRSGLAYGAVFMELDGGFKTIAPGGHQRLLRSQEIA